MYQNREARIEKYVLISYFETQKFDKNRILSRRICIGLATIEKF